MHAQQRSAVGSRPARHVPGALPVVRRAVVLAAWCAAPVLLTPPGEPVLGWLATGGGFLVGTGAWLASARLPEPAARGPVPSGTLTLARGALLVYGATLLLVIAVGLPILLVVWPVSHLLAAAAVVSGVGAALPWSLFALPGLVAGDDATTAIDRSVAWVATDPARTAAGTAACLVASLGPAIVAAAVAGALDWPFLVQRIAILVALGLTGGTLAAWMGRWAHRLDARRRQDDPWFARA